MDTTDLPFDYPRERTIRLEDAPHIDPEAAEQSADAITDAIAWLRSEFGADATVRLAGLTEGEHREIQDVVAGGTVGEIGEGAAASYIIAACVTEAPWYPAETDGLADRVQVIAHLPPQVARWLEAELDPLNELGNGD